MDLYKDVLDKHKTLMFNDLEIISRNNEMNCWNINVENSLEEIEKIFFKGFAKKYLKEENEIIYCKNPKYIFWERENKFVPFNNKEYILSEIKFTEEKLLTATGEEKEKLEYYLEGLYLN